MTAGAPAPAPSHSWQAAPAAGASSSARRGDVAAPAPFTVFLDRDGVFNVNPKFFIRRWQDFVWLPGVHEAFARLDRPGIRTCLVTNQPVVGIGLATPREIRGIHDRMVAELAAAGGRMDRIEVAYAPPLSRHRRRKPNPGMLEDAAAAFAAMPPPPEGIGGAVDKARAVMVGDKARDCGAGTAFGVPTVLLATSYPAQQLQQECAAAGLQPAAIVPDLAAAVEWILARADIDG